MLRTGYFADTKTWTKVHVVNGYKPICGSVISENKQFQFCSVGITYDYIECEKCKQKIKK